MFLLRPEYDEVRGGQRLDASCYPRSGGKKKRYQSFACLNMKERVTHQSTGNFRRKLPAILTFVGIRAMENKRNNIAGDLEVFRKYSAAREFLVFAFPRVDDHGGSLETCC